MIALRGRLIDGIHNEPIQDGLVLTDGSAITYAGTYREGLVPPDTQVFTHPDGTLLPGLIDCHAHLSAGDSVNGSPYATHNLDRILTAAHDIGILLDSGFTAVREMSLFGPHLKKAVARGVLRGPYIMSGGRVLSITSGHADEGSDAPMDYQRQTDPSHYLIDGVEGCLYGVRVQFRQGAEFIKICATGGVSSVADGLGDIQFAPEEMRVIVEEAARHNTYVAAHCSSLSGTLQALEAGVTSIEHGLELNERCIELMLKLDATLVSTISIATSIPKWQGNVSPHIYEKGCRVAEIAVKSIDLARRSGVRIALGTDYGNTPNTPYRHNGREISALVREAGFSPMEAIRVATANGAHLLRRPEIGTLAEGMAADVILVDGDPTRDIGVLEDGQRVRLVLKDGLVQKNTLL